MTGAEQRLLAAHHEAGHAVAACLRGEATPGEATIDGHGNGLAKARIKRVDGGFVAYAGAWAEARAAWPMGDLDGEDDDGVTFRDYVAGVLLSQPDDAADVVAQEVATEQIAPGMHAATEQVWAGELERLWPTVQALAARLLHEGAVSGPEVQTAVDAALAAVVGVAGDAEGGADDF